MKAIKIITVLFGVSLLSCDLNHGLVGYINYFFVNESSHDIIMEIYITSNQTEIRQFEKKILINKQDTVSFDHFIDHGHFYLFNVDEINSIPADSVVLKFDKKKQLSHYTPNLDTLFLNRNILYEFNYTSINPAGNGSPYYYYITDEDYELAIPY